MTISYNRNLSNLAELMGNDYTELDAANFAAYLIEERNITNTDQVTDAEWADLLTAWEVEMGITLA